MRKLTHSKYSSNDRLLIVNIREKKLQSREITDCSFFQHTILFSAYYVISGRNDNKLVFKTFDKAIMANPDAKPIFHSDYAEEKTMPKFKIIA